MEVQLRAGASPAATRSKGGSPIPRSLANDVVFSAKTFAAAMLALYLAFSLDLPRPYWALITAYIVARPLSGMMRSKAVYRLSGTLVGAAAAVALTPAFIDAPELLTFALALWVAACVFLSLLQPAPRNYTFRLSGYTAALVGFPCFDAPGEVFETALARVEEISLGAVCVALVSELVLPRYTGRYLMARFDIWLGAGARWACDALLGRESAIDQRRFIAEAAGLAELRVQAAYDTPELRAAEAATRTLHARVAMLAPAVFGLADRLRELGPGKAKLSPILATLAKWLSAGPRGAPDDAIAIREAIASARGAGQGLDYAGALARIDDLARLWRECLILRQEMRGRPGAAVRRGAKSDPPIDRDPAMAALSASALFAAILLCGGVSMAIGWQGGATATMMAATGGAIFAARDDPARMTMRFSLWTTVGALFAGLWLVAVMPMIDGFPLLGASLGLLLLPIGLATAKRATGASAIAFVYGFGGLMALQETYAVDFAAWANGVLSVTVGSWTVALIMALIRRVSPEWAARRLFAAGRVDLAAIAGARWVPQADDLAERMFDRIVAMGSRLAAAEGAAGALLDEAFADFGASLDLLRLRAERARLAPPARRAADLVLKTLARRFAGAPAPTLARRVDRALRRIASETRGDGALDAALAFDGLGRMALLSAQPRQEAHA